MNEQPPGEPKSNLRLAVGNNVKAARQRAGLSQRDLTKLTGLTQAYVSQLERGMRSVGLDAIEKIASAVGVFPDELLRSPRRSETARDVTQTTAARIKKATVPITKRPSR